MLLLPTRLPVRRVFLTTANARPLGTDVWPEVGTVRKREKYKLDQNGKTYLRFEHWGFLS